MIKNVVATIPVGIQYAKIDVECETVEEAIDLIKAHSNVLKGHRLKEGDPFLMESKEGKLHMYKKTDDGFEISFDGGVTWRKSSRLE